MIYKFIVLHNKRGNKTKAINQASHTRAPLNGAGERKILWLRKKIAPRGIKLPTYNYTHEKDETNTTTLPHYFRLYSGLFSTWIQHNASQSVLNIFKNQMVSHCFFMTLSWFLAFIASTVATNKGNHSWLRPVSCAAAADKNLVRKPTKRNINPKDRKFPGLCNSPDIEVDFLTLLFQHHAGSEMKSLTG